ncbi:MAG TPA: GDSL-type esterase/lipase family protein [Usitatibacteraceae bacterium]|nr:GDSL-type esterase/lipase family protein [Usitatibacteraceae bacterium]
MRSLLRLAALFAAAAIASCGDAVPRLPKLDPGAVILAFGDSLTFGTGASPREAYPAVLAGLVSRKVVAAGVPGETSGEGLERLPGVLDEVKPQLLVLCHGGNDFLRKMGEASAAANVREMIRLAQARGIAVVLLATPKPGFGASKVKFYEDIATELAIPVEADVLADVLGSRSLKSDLVHPNAEGYAEIAAAVAKLLHRAGAV